MQIFFKECVLRLCHLHLSVWWLPQQEDCANCPLHISKTILLPKLDDLVYMKPTNRRKYCEAKHCRMFPHVSRTWFVMSHARDYIIPNQWNLISTLLFEALLNVIILPTFLLSNFLNSGFTKVQQCQSFQFYSTYT